MPKAEKPGMCPECGVSLEGLDPRKHAIRHWGPTVPDPRRSKAAHDRYVELAGGE